MIPIASDLSYFVLQRRARQGELPPAVADSINRRLYPGLGYRAFIADVDEGDCPDPNPRHVIDVPQHTLPRVTYFKK